MVVSKKITPKNINRNKIYTCKWSELMVDKMQLWQCLFTATGIHLKYINIYFTLFLNTKSPKFHWNSRSKCIMWIACIVYNRQKKNNIKPTKIWLFLLKMRVDDWLRLNKKRYLLLFCFAFVIRWNRHAINFICRF